MTVRSHESGLSRRAGPMIRAIGGEVRDARGT